MRGSFFKSPLGEIYSGLSCYALATASMKSLQGLK